LTEVSNKQSCHSKSPSYFETGKIKGEKLKEKEEEIAMLWNLIKEVSKGYDCSAK
jgi:hypothetical protein